MYRHCPQRVYAAGIYLLICQLASLQFCILIVFIHTWGLIVFIHNGVIHSFLSCRIFLSISFDISAVWRSVYMQSLSEPLCIVICFITLILFMSIRPTSVLIGYCTGTLSTVGPESFLNNLCSKRFSTS